MSEFIGSCKYCGQILKNDARFESQDDADRWATENCGCSGARIERKRREQIENAQARVEELFRTRCDEYGLRPVEDEKVIHILYDLVECAAEGRVLSATISLNGYGKAGISVDSKGELLVKRSETKAYQLKG